jgi:hypothetical protein
MYRLWRDLGYAVGALLASIARGRSCVRNAWNEGEPTSAVS